MVSNTLSQLPENTHSSFTNFLPEQLNLECQWEVEISEVSYPSMYQNVTEGKFMCFDKKLSKSLDFHYLEPGLYPSLTDIVEAMNTLIQQRHKHSENCITVKVYRRTQKVEIYFANGGSGLAFFSTDLGHIFGSNVSDELGVMLRGKGTHQPEFVYDIVRIHSLLIYTDLIEYNIGGDTKAPLLRCFPFISKLKSGDIITSGQYINYHTFSNLQFRPLLKIFLHSIHIDLRDTRVKKNNLYLSVSVVLFWCSEKPPTFISNLKKLQDDCCKTSRDSILWRCWPTTWMGIMCTCTGYWENCNSIFAWRYRPCCKLRMGWLAGICCARNCRGCNWWKKFQGSCKEWGKTDSEKTVG